MRIQQWQSTLKILQFTGLALLIASLPLSNLLMSIATFWIAGVWLLEISTDIFLGKKPSRRLRRFTSDLNALMLCGLFLLPVIGLLWTEDFSYAQWDLRMKLPLLLLPFLLSTIDPITDRAFRGLLGVFILSVTFAVVWCLLIYWQINPRPYQDAREISVFISHIRFSLLIVLGLCIVFVEAWDKPSGMLFSIFISIPFLYFMYIVASMTGFIVLSCIILWTIVRFIFKTNKPAIKWLLGALIIALPLTGFLVLRSSYNSYFNVQNVDWNDLEKTSANGEIYDHNPQYRAVESGHYVMTHIAWGELYEGWKMRSDIYPDSLDGRGHILKGTLIRYLASKGLRKDLDGIQQLSDDDVKAIESGIPVYNAHEKSGLRKRLDNIFFELSNYRAGGNPSGHSVFQRFEFWKAAMSIIADHPVIGVGTGDVKQSFIVKYDEMHSPLDQTHRLRAHNQYLTFWLTFGIFGLIYFIAMIVVPTIRKRKNTLFVAFTIIASMSFLTEDTLESQAGVTFFAFFYIFFTLKRKLNLATLRPVKS